MKVKVYEEFKTFGAIEKIFNVWSVSLGVDKELNERVVEPTVT